MLGVFYECVDCRQELFHCDACGAFFHVTEMGFVSQQKNYCMECKDAALNKLPITVTIRRHPQNMARLTLVRKA